MKPPPPHPKQAQRQKKRGDGGGQDRPSRRRGTEPPIGAFCAGSAFCAMRAKRALFLRKKQLHNGGVLRPPIV